MKRITFNIASRGYPVCVPGYLFQVSGHQFVVHKIDAGWLVSDYKTGFSTRVTGETRSQAIESARHVLTGQLLEALKHHCCHSTRINPVLEGEEA